MTPNGIGVAYRAAFNSTKVSWPGNVKYNIFRSYTQGCGMQATPCYV